ncbi:MAG: transposase [Alphaproteobacteria bacterium]|nr:transposase [Alphaproteobacteria bacterium]
MITHGKLRDECLNKTLSDSRADAREALENWLHDCNHQRPHSALGNLTSREFVAKIDMDKLAAWHHQLNSMDSL